MKYEILLSVAVGAFFAAHGIAKADTLKVGDSLNYQYTTAQVIPVDPAIPKDMVQQIGAKPTTATTTFTFTVAIDRLDPNGNAHATISPHYSVNIRGWAFPDFEGSVLPDGQIVPKYDPTVLKGSGLDETSTAITPGYRPQTHEEQVNFHAYSFSRRLSFFNDVALGAAKHKTFKDGDAWRIVIPDKNNETINFSYTGTQSYRGHEVVALALTAVHTTQNGPTTAKGMAYYDSQQNLLVGLHSQGDDDTPEGARAQTIDINLQP